MRLESVRVLSVAMFLLVSGTSVFAQAGSVGYRNLDKGTSLHGVYGKTDSGQSVRLADDARPAVVFLFEPGCEMCRAGIEDLARVYRSTSSEYFWIGITSDSARLSEFIRETAVPWPSIWVSKKTWEDFKVDATPTLYLTDRRKRVVSGRLVRAEDLENGMTR